MRRVTSDGPGANTTSANENPKSETLNNDYHHASIADIKAIPRTPCTMFIVNPEVHVQDLLGFSSEALASACVIIMNQADRETGSSRNTLLGAHLIISSAEISVNRALDHLDPVE